jgi:hypothetical protein
MTIAPSLVTFLTQVNSSDAPQPGGTDFQGDGPGRSSAGWRLRLVWTDSSRTHNPNGSAIVGQRYDSLGNKVEVRITQFSSGDQ